jgi:hypothetical protein
MKEIEVVNFNLKRKLLLFILNISFILGGIFLIIISLDFRPFWVVGSAWIPGIVGLVGTVYFGLVLVSYLKIVRRKAALIIDNDGIVDNSSFIAVGRILWSQITEIKAYDAGPVSYILVYVDEPVSFIERNGNFFERWHLRNNFKRYRTPVAIPLIWLHIYIDDLNTLLLARFENFKNQ